MTKKAKTLLEMFLSVERLYGEQAAETWADRNLSYDEARMLKRAIEALEKSDDLHGVTESNNGCLFPA